MKYLVRGSEKNKVRQFYVGIFSFSKADIFSMAGLWSKFPTRLKGKRASKMRRLFSDSLIPFSLLLFPLILLSNTSQTRFEQANDAYTKGQYKKAIEQYEAILAEENQSVELYFNLGNAYYKTQETGKAILNFERALVLNPSDEDAAYNVALINDQIPDQLDVVSDFFLKKWWLNFHTTFTSGTWSVLTLVGLWLGVGGLLLWLLGSTRSRKKLGFIAGISMLLLSTLLFFAANSQGNKEQNSRKAIVLVDKSEVRNGPDVESTALLPIHEGLKVELLDQIGDWWKVKLSNGEQGWLPMSDLEEI